MANANALRCEPCDRSFARREHLERHRLVHSGEKRFTCSVCKKSYARRDVYRRHLRGHGPSAPISELTRQNVHVACDACHRRKVKCHSSERPCPRCNADGVVCTFERQPILQSGSTLISPSTTLQSPEAPESSPSVFVHAHDHPSAQRLLDDVTSNEESVPQPDPPHGEDCTFDVNLHMLSDSTDSAPPSSHNFTDIDLFSLPFDHNFFAPLDNDDVFGSFAYSFDLFPFENGPNTSHVSCLQADLEVGTQSQAHDYLSRQWARLTTAYGKLYEFTNTSHPTRPPTPKSASLQQEYISELGSTESPTFDRVIINVFVGLFQKHVAPTFPCFQNFRITRCTHEELYLAMAAVGGLYCRIPKAELVAKWMFHTSRRQLLTAEHGRVIPDTSRKLGILQSYILLEIFAYACGDGRVTMLLEVFHNQAVQAFHSFDWTSLETAPSQPTKHSLFYALNVVECYRVVLLQRPSMIYPSSTLDNLMPSHQLNDLRLPQALSSALLYSLLSSDGRPINIRSSMCSMESLCALSILAAHGHSLPGSTKRRSRAIGSTTQHSSAAWRSELLELALHRWLCSHDTTPSTDIMMLYHIIHLSVYSDFSQISRMAKSSLARGRQSNRDGLAYAVQGASQVNQDSVKIPGGILQTCFTNDEAEHKAAWHAMNIVTMAQRMQRAENYKSGERIHLVQQDSPLTTAESVHYSHAVYYASMILWTTATLRDSSNQVEQGRSNQLPVAVKALREGIDLLSHCRSRVADTYKHALQSLVETS